LSLCANKTHNVTINLAVGNVGSLILQPFETKCKYFILRREIYIKLKMARVDQLILLQTVLPLINKYQSNAWDTRVSGPNFIIKDLPSVLILIIADQLYILL